jgi:hypothetical protein
VSNNEVLEWAAMLGRSREDRVAAIEDLLAHASEDGMNNADRAACRRALRLLRGL